MTEPSIEDLFKARKTLPQLTNESIEKLFKDYGEKLARAIEKTKMLPVGLIDTEILGQTITEAVEGYRKTINDLFIQICEHSNEENKWQLEEFKRLKEQADAEIMGLLNQILELLKKLGQNVDLERAVLLKLDTLLPQK